MDKFLGWQHDKICTLNSITVCVCVPNALYNVNLIRWEHPKWCNCLEIVIWLSSFVLNKISIWTTAYVEFLKYSVDMSSSCPCMVLNAWPFQISETTLGAWMYFAKCTAEIENLTVICHHLIPHSCHDKRKHRSSVWSPMVRVSDWVWWVMGLDDRGWTLTAVMVTGWDYASWFTPSRGMIDKVTSHPRIHKGIGYDPFVAQFWGLPAEWGKKQSATIFTLSCLQMCILYLHDIIRICTVQQCCVYE